MSDRTESTIVIGAPPSAVLDVITDYEAYPEWTGAMKQSSSKGQIAAERVDGSMAYAVRTLQGEADAALKSVGEIAELRRLHPVQHAFNQNEPTLTISLSQHADLQDRKEVRGISGGAYGSNR